MLKNEQLYVQMIEIYKKDVHRIMANMGRTMQKMFGFLIATATIAILISFTLGYVFGKMTL